MKSEYEPIIVLNDIHIPFQDQKALSLVNLFLADNPPDWLILNGDIMDCWAISRFNRTPKGGKELREEIDETQDFLLGLRRLLPKTKITYIFGNHEFRLKSYLIRNAQELYGLITLQDLLELAKMKIEWKDTPEGAGRFIDNFVKVGALYVGHFDKISKHAGYTAKALVEDKGVSVLQGHCHRCASHGKILLDGTELIGIENGCLCDRNPSYISHPNWMLGFSVVYKKKNDDRFIVYPIRIVKYKFFFGGKEYRI